MSFEKAKEVLKQNIAYVQDNINYEQGISGLRKVDKKSRR